MPVLNQLAMCLFLTAGLSSIAFAQNSTGGPAAPATPPGATAQPPIAPISANERLQWLLKENLGLGAELDDIAVGAADTLFNTPKEYGPHWLGFGERIGLVTANYATESTMEVTLGSFWGEDPRYIPTSGLTVKSRLGNVIKMAFVARSRSGGLMPAYSRYIAYPATGFISNEWEPKSQSTTGEALGRAGLGFLSRIGENAWKEFITRRP